MTKQVFLLLNLVLAFYNIGTIWAMEVDIFRSWRHLDPKTFKLVQTIHWKKLPYWIFFPVILAFVGSIFLFWHHPDNIPIWEIWTVFLIQLISHILTAIFWGQWQAKLSKDELGGASPYLDKILRTHWIRTFLINAYGLMLLFITIQSIR